MKVLKTLALSLLALLAGCQQKVQEPLPNEQEPSYKLGDYYAKGLAKGIIVSLDEDGEHGLLLSMDEKRLQWSTLSSSIICGASYVSMDDGAVNAEGVKGLYENWPEEFPAIAWCSSKNLGALNSWYLPAASEIRLILDVAGTQSSINETLVANGGTAVSPEELYWSSTDAGAQIAYAYRYRADLKPEDELYDMSPKKNSLHCRCVRRF